MVIVACGPSVAEANLAALAGNPRIDTMTINKPQAPLFPTTFWAFCDHSQYARNKVAFESYDGILINSSSIRVPHKKQILVRNRSGKGFSKDLTQGFYIGRSTTYANMQTALWMGYNRIYIFGCDMGEVNGRMWSYGNNPDVNAQNRAQRFAAESQHFTHGVSTLNEEQRSRFYICSTYNRWPWVKKLNQRNQRTVHEEILEYASSLG